MPHNALVDEWKASGTSLSYGGWLERELRKARKDSARLDWLAQSKNVTPRQASAIVNSFVWDSRYRGSIRGAIDAAMHVEVAR